MVQPPTGLPSTIPTVRSCRFAPVTLRTTNRLLVLLMLLCPTIVEAETYYVRASGNDTNTGKAPNAAFATIKQAAKMIQSGDTVKVGAGTYTDDIVVNDVQQSTQTAEFVVEYGAVVINAQWKIVNSNYVQITGFTFRGAANRLLVWKGSYEGLIEDCAFDTGGNGLLINSGSLTMQNCQITDFGQDGIQVDGEARLVMRDSTISGCQQSGLEIRKVANVIFENCDVKDNLGNGVELNITTDTIDTGPDGPGSWKGRVPLAGADGPVFMGGGSEIEGDLHRPAEYYVDPSKVSGSIYDLLASTTFPPVDPGDAATNNDNAGIPLTDNNKDPLNGANQFNLNSNDGIDLPPGTYYFTKLDCKPNSELRISGSTIIYVAGNVVLKGDVNVGGAPGNLQIYVMGSLVEITSQADVSAAFYAPDATVKMRGGSDVEGMVLAGNLDMAGSSGIKTHPSLVALAESLILAPPSSPSPPSTWTPVTSGELDISGSSLTNNASGVRIVTEQAFNSRYTDYSNNADWGLALWGASRVENCTINGNVIGGVWLKEINASDLTVSNLTIQNNVQYGLFAEDCDLTFDTTNISDWAISGSQYAIVGDGSDLTLDSVTISGGSVAAVRSYQGTMNANQTTFSGSGYGLTAESSDVTLDNCTFSGNTVGLYANQNSNLLARNSTITGNSLWGAAVYASGVAGETTTFENCVIHNNVGGMTVVNANDGEVLLRNGTVIRDNAAAGLHFVNCNLAVNDQAGGSAWRTLRNLYGITSYQSTLTLSGVTVEDSTSYGIHCQDSNVTLVNCTVSGGDGIYADSTNDSLTVESSRFDASTSAGWGVARYGGNVEIKNSIFNGYGGGIYLYTLAAAEQATLYNITVGNAGTYGVYVADGDATVRNTIITGSTGSSGLVRLNGTLTHTHNLIHGFTTPYSGTSADDTEFQKTPRFVDAANGDYHLDVGSPAINAGLDLGMLVLADMEGNTRPSFHAFEIGAYEYTNPNGSFRVLAWTETK